MINVINRHERLIDDFLILNPNYRISIRYDFKTKDLTFEMWNGSLCLKRKIDNQQILYSDLEGEMLFISSILQEGKEAFENVDHE